MTIIKTTQVDPQGEVGETVATRNDFGKKREINKTLKTPIAGYSNMNLVYDGNSYYIEYENNQLKQKITFDEEGYAKMKLPKGKRNVINKRGIIILPNNVSDGTSNGINWQNGIFIYDAGNGKDILNTNTGKVIQKGIDCVYFPDQESKKQYPIGIRKKVDSKEGKEVMGEKYIRYYIDPNTGTQIGEIYTQAGTGYNEAGVAIVTYPPEKKIETPTYDDLQNSLIDDKGNVISVNGFKEFKNIYKSEQPATKKDYFILENNDRYYTLVSNNGKETLADKIKKGEEHTIELIESSEDGKASEQYILGLNETGKILWAYNTQNEQYDNSFVGKDFDDIKYSKFETIIL